MLFLLLLIPSKSEFHDSDKMSNHVEMAWTKCQNKLRRTKCQMTTKKSGQNANKLFGILSVGILSVGILSAHHNIIKINSLFQHFGFLKVRKVPTTPYPSGAGTPVEWPFLSHKTLLSTETGAFQQNLLNDKRTMNTIMQHRSERKYLLAQQCYSSQLNRLHFDSSLGCFVQRGSTSVKKAFFFNTISVATFVCLWSWKD